ncbi:MAG: hypothetical protein H6Q54_132 [Deltaproteobacteria bacterium]|jgi:hypothetical protein|nr:hypothetical protein [Deltaproteobacteria bacterium]
MMAKELMEEGKHTSAKKIRYCGNCNPEVHPKHIRTIVEKIAAGKGSDILVLVNGCSRECLTKSKDVYPGKTTISLNAGELVTDDEEPGGEGE